MNAHLYSLLRPGGTLLLIDHHATPGSGDRDGFDLHRMDAELTRQELEQAGFSLEISSDLLANPADDRTRSVFDPSIRGQTARFVYVFRK
jgi:predicted methyltransferase